MPEHIVVRTMNAAESPSAVSSTVGSPAGSRKEHREPILGLWGLTPLKNLAAHLALDGSWPEPAERRQPPPLTRIADCQDEWDEGGDLRFPQLLVGSVEGRYLPIPPAHIQIGEPGSIIGLERECIELAAELEIPEDHSRVERELLESEAGRAGGRWRRYRYETLGCIVLLRACRLAIREHAALGFRWTFDERPQDIALTDQTAFYLGADRFCGCRLLEEGAAVEFVLCSGDAYRVPTAYLMSWYDLETGQGGCTARKVVLHPEADERDADEGTVLAVFSDDREVLVRWDAVLMACEPEYENYGSLTARGRSNIEKWTERHGPFRVLADERRRETGEE